MKGVTLVSGGLDSTVSAVLLRDQGIDQIPVFIDYGQLAASVEWKTCETILGEQGLQRPIRLDFKDFGRNVKSGLTDDSMDIVQEAFLPGRNLLFLVAGASIAAHNNGSFVSIGLLNEECALFPDQTRAFLKSVEDALAVSLRSQIKVLAPLFDRTKAEVILLAEELGIDLGKVYSCHAGGHEACGSCISCRERTEAVRLIVKRGGD